MSIESPTGTSSSCCVPPCITANQEQSECSAGYVWNLVLKISSIAAALFSGVVFVATGNPIALGCTIGAGILFICLQAENACGFSTICDVICGLFGAIVHTSPPMRTVYYTPPHQHIPPTYDQRVPVGRRSPPSAMPATIPSSYQGDQRVPVGRNANPLPQETHLDPRRQENGSDTTRVQPGSAPIGGPHTRVPIRRRH